MAFLASVDSYFLSVFLEYPHDFHTCQAFLCGLVNIFFGITVDPFVSRGIEFLTFRAWQYRNGPQSDAKRAIVPTIVPRSHSLGIWGNGATPSEFGAIARRGRFP